MVHLGGLSLITCTIQTLQNSAGLKTTLACSEPYFCPSALAPAGFMIPPIRHQTGTELAPHITRTHVGAAQTPVWAEVDQVRCTFL